MTRFQPIYDIAELCFRKGLRQAVLCPGSRCAPLTLAFARHSGIITRTISDERSAAFIALGMAQQEKLATILLCTSGTAAYNLSPAVAEAYFSETPLVVFTADRPLEWVAQQDGQTIYQSEIFGKHVKKSFQLPQDYEHVDSRWAINRIVNNALNLAMENPKGPVHINAPFREPLYPHQGEILTYTSEIRVLESYQTNNTLTENQKQSISESWPSFKNILIVCGQHEHDNNLLSALTHLFSRHNIPVVGDVISNLHGIEKLIRHADLFLGQASDDVKKSLQPDLLITFGKSVLAKNLKTFLRKNHPLHHWHIQPAGLPADTFQSLTQIFHADPTSFFTFVSALNRLENFENQKQDNFNKFWEVEERRTLRSLHEFFPQQELSEIELVKNILSNLPSVCNLHLANSMSVRYANYIGLNINQSGVKVFANRGTSGIDGCTSTAVGHALMNELPNILITGDLAFFYDRNAFWHNYKIPNLRILLLNNHGGMIFGMLDGPSALPESQEYFITEQRLNAKKLCEEFGIVHLKLDNKRKLKNLIQDFYDFDGSMKILEFETDTVLNKVLLDNLKMKIHKSYEF